MKAGKTMKQAAKSWKPTSATKKRRSSSTSKPKRSVRKIAKKKRTTKSGFKLPGGVGPKGILTALLGMMIVPRFIPVQSPGAQKLGTGLALKFLGLTGGGALSTVGIVELAAQFLGPTLSGLTGGATGAQGNGGYDF